MSVRVQVFQHVPYEGIGSMESVFAAHEARVAGTLWYLKEEAPALESFDLLLVMGGPMSVGDEGQYPWLREEKRALKQALDAGKPVLGICLGAQLLAEVLGGAVTRNPCKEIGWFPVESLSTVPACWVSACFPQCFRTFHWHGDTFSIPPGAVHLFGSAGCSNQGFAWKDRVVGLQFHPEITSGAIAAWLKNGDEDLQAGSYVQPADQMQGQPGDFAANNRWIAKVCRELMRIA